MRHEELNEGDLRAYLDGQLDLRRSSEVDQHVKSCQVCSGEMDTLRSHAARVRDGLDLLPQIPVGDPSATAWAGFQKRRGEWKDQRLSQWTFWRGLSVAGGSVATVAVLLVLTVAPIRLWAENLLAIFRVERFTVLDINPALLKNNGLQNNPMLNQSLGRLLSDELTVTQSPEKAQLIKDPASAAKMAGFPVELFAGETPSSLLLESGAGMNLKLDRDRIQSILDEAGHGDLHIPASVDGAVIGVRVPRGVMARYGNCGDGGARTGGATTDATPGQSATGPCISLFELPSPVVSAPQEIDPAQIAQIALQLLGMSAKDASSFTKTVNWSSTFVLPVVRGESRYEQVQVHGNEGALLRPANQDAAGHFTLMWVENGIVFALNGTGDDTTAINLTSRLQ